MVVMDAIHRKKWTQNKSDNSILSYNELESMRVLCSTDSGTAGTRDIKSCPQRQFWADLKTLVEEAHTNGKQVIVMGDWNSRMKDVDSFFETLEREEAIQEQHDLTPPITCQKLYSEPIDGIYTSSTLVGIRGSYLAFGKLGGDHADYY